MKRLLIFIVTLFISCSLSLQADDFIRKENVPSGWDYRGDWCSFNDVGCSLPVYVEKTNSNNLYITIYNNDWTIRKMFSITGLIEQDIVIQMEDENKSDGNDGYKREMKVSQYFFNDDDKYEIVIGHKDNDYYRNVRVINEDGIMLGTLPNAFEFLRFFVIGCRHYINYDDTYYSFPGQTGAPLQRLSKDVNGDGSVNAADVTAIYNVILGN